MLYGITFQKFSEVQVQKFVQSGTNFHILLVTYKYCGILKHIPHFISSHLI